MAASNSCAFEPKLVNSSASATPAHDAFLDGGLLTRLLTLLDEIDPDDPATVAPVCERVREAVLGQPMPPSVAGSIRAAYAGLRGEPYVAVRSSGTAEDLAGA